MDIIKLNAPLLMASRTTRQCLQMGDMEYGTLILDIGQLDTAGNKEQPMDSLIIAIIIIAHMIRLMIGNILIITKIGALQAKDSVFGAHVRIGILLPKLF